MPSPELTPDELLTTTRGVRKRLDLARKVETEVIRECVQAAQQAPTGMNFQRWRFVVVTDKDKREALAELYRRGWAMFEEGPGASPDLFPDDPRRAAQHRRELDASRYLAEHLHEVPVHLVPCIIGRETSFKAFPTQVNWASLYPAVWSYMLAARARGLGTCITSLHLIYEREAAELLGIPYEEVAQGALIPTAYAIGTEFKSAQRVPLDSVLYHDGWQ